MIKKLFLVVDTSRPNHFVTRTFGVTRLSRDDVWVTPRPDNATICTSPVAAKSLLKKAKAWVRRELRYANREATRPNTKHTVYSASYRRQNRQEAKILKGIKLKVVPYKAC